jgi:hypothetical protein
MRAQEAINRTREVIRRQHKALASARFSGTANLIEFMAAAPV